MDDSAQDPNVENYLQLLNSHERALSAYVYTLVNDRTDAEDILQSTKLTLWKRFSDFSEGTNFVAWARKIALHQILNYRRSEKRKPRYAADSAFLEAVAEEIDQQSDQLERRSEALRNCLSKLPDKQKRTILLRYYEDAEISEIAQKTERTEGAVYRLLSRIRESLNECVTQQLSQNRL